MKRVVSVLVLSVVLGGVDVAHAASQDECAIWLCLPQGFAPSACGGAQAAFNERIMKQESPLPDLSECGGNSNDGSYKVVASGYTQPHQVCDNWGDSCHMVSGSITDNYDWETSNRNIPRIEVFVNGQQAGSSYYYSLVPLSNQLLTGKDQIVQYYDAQYYQSLSN